MSDQMIRLTRSASAEVVTAGDKISALAAYLDECDVMRVEPDKHRIRALVEGRKIEADTQTEQEEGAT